MANAFVRIRSFYGERFRREWLGRDLIAGLVLASLLVPQGMAYAELAGLPAITGLYTSLVCLVAYALIGPSRVLVLGPDSALGSMIAATVIPLTAAGGDPNKAVIYASVMALMVGAVLVIGAVAGLGFIADLLSKPTQIGYMNGLALAIFVGQLPKLFGFSVDADNLIAQAREFVVGVAQGSTVPASLAIGLVSLAIILALRRAWPPSPAILFAVIVAMVAAAAFELASHGVKLVGILPSGLPPFSVPIPDLRDVPLLAAGALGIAVVSLADTISTSSAFASRSGQNVRADREMIGIGAADVAAGFFGGFPVSTSASRTSVAAEAGSKSQVTGLVGAAVIAFVLVFAPGLFAFLPQPTLAAVVIVAALGLADITAMAALWRERRSEFGLALAAFLGVALLGVLVGIAIAVVLSILAVFIRVWNPYRTVLGDVRGVAGFHDVEMYPDARQVPGLVIFRFDAPLIFANARAFRDELRTIAEKEPRPRWIVVAAEPMTDIDSTGGDTIAAIDEELAKAGIELKFAELKDAVRQKIRTYGIPLLADDSHFYPTVTAAARAYRDLTGIERPFHHAG